MKQLRLHFFKTYLSIGLFCYYKQFKVHNVERVPKNKPVLFLANHQNALIDPLLIATKSGRFCYFLTRASVFNKPLISKFLRSLQLLPVYRIRDGWSSITNNNSIFSTCTEVLNQNKAVVIFPEGNHHINRSVRPLSKGFTRIVFETLEKYPETDLQIIPVGINYNKADDFVDSTSVFFGKPIAAKKYLSTNKNKAINTLKEDVYQAICKLTTHIPSENYAETIAKLEEVPVNFLNPEAVNNCISSNFETCQKHEKSKTNYLKIVLKYVLLANFLPPFLVWKYYAKPKIKEIEFVATFRFALYITLFPLWFFILVSIVSVLFGWQVTALYGIVISALALFYVKS
ncbi:lysophospholipid acyltransferase family protein [Oceanihabitans sp. 1_MG-2023]|uniref:lysophospholipid acyltransferase family protein n=1 Tax=Flavobacteriaceae TaxID=49546 RepID=UPI0026E308A8|nr:lysophospholipid acyltransferase family protein [Oceanihabitans sp. 1_MG-2023]MDO6622292.1 lysophospholipid acyltransferase family protein [Oceanihabitans sp. 1_MG-2023]